MKLKKLLYEQVKELLNEFEIGKVLLGDPHGDETPGIKMKWSKLGIPFEKNTEDEQRLLDILRFWIGEVEEDPRLLTILKKLLPLKSKFPKILDPKQYKGRDGFVYRGTLVPASDMVKLRGWERKEGEFGEVLETDYKYTWNPRGEKGFTSFSPDPMTVIEFADQYGDDSTFNPTYFVNNLMHNKIEGKMLPVILKVADSNPNLIMNPDFINTLTDLEEFETFLLGTPTKVDGVIIPNYDFLEAAAKEDNVDLTRYFRK